MQHPTMTTEPFDEDANIDTHRMFMHLHPAHHVSSSLVTAYGQLQALTHPANCFPLPLVAGLSLSRSIQSRAYEKEETR